jgi:hypothetical protein
MTTWDSARSVRAWTRASFLYRRVCQMTGGRPMTGSKPLRRMNAYPVPSRRTGSCRIMSSVMTGCRVSCSAPRSRAAMVPASLLAISSVSGSDRPGRNTLTPQVSRMVRAPSLPHRVRSWAGPCTTGMICTPRPPASASSDGRPGTGQVWVTSSSAHSIGGSSRPPGIVAAASAAWW